MNYIVKKCPSCKEYNVFGVDTDCCCYDKHDYCKNITDCVIKQVIDKCKGAVFNYSNLEILRTACETSEAYGKANIAEQILQLFDIKEVRE